MVLHTGADQLRERTADFVLENIASQISHAKKKRKTNQAFVCSVEERQDAGVMINETVKQELSKICMEYGAQFLDVRSRVAECKFAGKWSRCGVNCGAAAPAVDMFEEAIPHAPARPGTHTGSARP